MTIDELKEEIYETNKYGYKYLRYDKKPAKELVDFYKSNYNIQTDCHSSCINCQINYIDKYKNELGLLDSKSMNLTGKHMDKWFKIKCTYISKGLSGEYAEKLEELEAMGIERKRAIRVLLSTVDPSSWSELMFGFDDETMKLPDLSKQWYLRWYQKHILRCTSNRIVLRQGRRSGKTASAVLFLIHKIFNYKVYKGLDPDTKEELYSGPAIAVVTPFQSQVSVIFDELENFVKRSKDLEKQVVTRGSKLYKQTPPLLMEFKNGASIKGFVTGSNNKEDGSGGGAIRGITADILYLDEMDMIPENIYSKVLEPLKMSKPHTYFIGSSTPIGKKATFYKWCNDDLSYKEMYVPSTVLPHWEQTEEDSAISESTQDAFRAEYMADFVIDSYGVFKNPLIISARTDYVYEDTDNADFWMKNFNEDYYSFIKCIGIDWNKTVGTEYSVSAYSPKTGKFWVLENYLLNPSEYSGDAYKEKLKDLNFKWNPQYIYADEGYGNFLLEDLQLQSMFAAGVDQKTPYIISVSKIKEKLHIINFSSNIKLFNRATGKYFEKYAKNFLIENAVQIFEREVVRFSESDYSLTKQLGNYIEKDKKDSGKIIYDMENKKIGDHRLDAFCLALAGLVIEESLFSPNFRDPSAPQFISAEENRDSFANAIKESVDFARFMKTNDHGIKIEGIISLSENNNTNRSFTSAGLNRRELFTNDNEKGYFSKRGMARFVETNSKENYEGGPDRFAPLKRSPRKAPLRRPKF